MIQLHRLEGFYRVAIAGGYTRAVRSFPYPITQPGVYQQVSKLEEDLGIQLLTRAGRDRVIPTPAGERLLAFCKPFFEGLPGVIEQLATGRYGGTLRIDAAALEIRYVLPQWLRRFRARWPEVRVDLEEVGAADLARLSEGRSDLLVEFLADIPKGFGAHRVGTHYAFLIAPSDWRAASAKKQPLALAELAGEPFIAFHPSLPHARRQLAAIQTMFPPRQLLTASSTEAILGFVAAGLGYSLIPWPDERGPRVAGVVAHRIRGADTEFPILAVWKRGAAAEELIERALEVAPSA